MRGQEDTDGETSGDCKGQHGLGSELRIEDMWMGTNVACMQLQKDVESLNLHNQYVLMILITKYNIKN